MYTKAELEGLIRRENRLVRDCGQIGYVFAKGRHAGRAEAYADVLNQMEE